MERVICADIMNEKTRALLEREVKRVVLRNKKVFDNLAKK